MKPTEPIVLGALGEVVFTSKTRLPVGYAPQYSDKLDLSEDFADYHAEYSIANGILTANRKLVVKKSEVPVSSWDSYKKFCKALADERDRYINLTTGEAEYPDGEGPNSSATTTAVSAGKAQSGSGSVRKTPAQNARRSPACQPGRR